MLITFKVRKDFEESGTDSFPTARKLHKNELQLTECCTDSVLFVEVVGSSVQGCAKISLYYSSV